ncbi:hypothetical protein GOODEAATRI_028110 [Goodea atripinnis]|uniref:Uncharacterized protein n=1 Tax=Goodea atripinnis TaxID=208336 RepID=A0ABV0MMN3_9TELE
MTLEEQLLMSTSLGRVNGSFPNHMKSIILQREGLFPNGQHLRQLPIFPGENVPADSAQGTGPRHHSDIDGTTNSSVYQRTLEAGSKLGHQQNNDTDIADNLLENGWKKTGLNSDLNLIELFWWDLQRAVQKQISQLKQCWKIEWTRIPPSFS